MHFSSQIGERLKEERERLGLSQTDAAEIAGVRREMWGKYERGAADPGGSVIEHFCAHGADARYIMTGTRDPGLAVPMMVLQYINTFLLRLHEATKGKDLMTVALECRIRPVELNSYLEGRELPRLDVAYALAASLNVTPQWLLAGEGAAKDHNKH